MQAKNIIHQRPCPRIQIIDPEEGRVKFSFYQSNISSLQSFSFSLSTDDTTGSFNLLFFPEHGDKSLFDEISLLDVVTIYEDYTVVNRASGETQDIKPAYPIFTGIIRSKKYAAQGNEAGVTRRMSVSGTAITGLVSQFQISLDVAAQAIRNQTEASSKFFALTEQNASEKKAKNVILNTWNVFLDLSTKTGAPTIANYITKWMGEADEFFDVGDIDIGYPIATLFAGETTQDFFSLVDKILPSPYYEKSAYTDSNGKMKIRMRKCPFNTDSWMSLNKIAIDNKRVKSFDITQSDNEVYSCFVAYLEGSAQAEQPYLITALNEAKDSDKLKIDEDKFGKYGYRPLIVHCRGYNAPNDADERSDASASASTLLTTATEEIASWYGSLDEMLSGSITLAMTYSNDTDRIMPGDVVEFLWNEFYVDGISHSWTYNGGGEINLSVSRGGRYKAGSWSKPEKITEQIKVARA